MPARRFKRGLLPQRPGAIKLRFRDYIKLPALPPLPPIFGCTITPPAGWGMDANDEVGDCVIAGFNHSDMLWRVATARAVPPFTDASALADYSRALVATGGSPYDPSDPSTDTGLDMQAAADWWRTTGITDAAGHKHKIRAYAAVETVQELLYAAFLFGAAGLGVNLPDTAEEQFAAGHAWDDVTSPSTGGHFIPVIGRNTNGNLVIVTWGKTHELTPQFAAARMMPPALGLFSTDYLAAGTGLSPGAFNEAQLDADLADLGAA